MRIHNRSIFLLTAICLILSSTSVAQNISLDNNLKIKIANIKSSEIKADDFKADDKENQAETKRLLIVNRIRPLLALNKKPYKNALECMSILDKESTKAYQMFAHKKGQKAQLIPMEFEFTGNRTDINKSKSQIICNSTSPGTILLVGLPPWKISDEQRMNDLGSAHLMSKWAQEKIDIDRQSISLEYTPQNVLLDPFAVLTKDISPDF